MRVLQQIPLPRRVWVASWLFAGVTVLASGSIVGTLQFETLMALYFGFGAGIELTLFVGGWRDSQRARRARVTEETPALAEPDNNGELIFGLKQLGIRGREAMELVGAIPAGPIEERIRLALVLHGEER